MVRGSTTTDHKFAYFAPKGSKSIYSYEFDTAIVSSSDGHYVFVIRGNVGDRWVINVELLLVQRKEWHKLTNLRLPHPYPSATICGNEIFVVTEEDGYKCSFQALYILVCQSHPNRYNTSFRGHLFLVFQ